MSMMLDVGITEHTEEDAPQRKIMLVLIPQTAGLLRNATPWTDSSKASPAQRLPQL